MINSLANIFNNLKLSWIDSAKNLKDSKEYQELLSIFPNLEQIFQQGQIEDDFEFRRTIQHIFRVFKVYFLIKDKIHFHKTLSQDSIGKVSEKIKAVNKLNELVIPLILMYHDIGRFFNKKNHPHESYIMISEQNLLDSYGLSEIEKLLVSKVIQYHLLFATIYTGESTFFGIYSVLNDEEFNKLNSYEGFNNRFIDLLEIFTWIDILGYSYARLYDHYSKYYDEINFKLKHVLSLLPDKKKPLEKALDYSQEWIDWRIAGGLRIFQFVDTQPYLTTEFYYNKLKESLKECNLDLINGMDWEMIKRQFLIHSCKIQVKYALGFLMLLAFGDFSRSRITEDKKISSNLILFWILLSKEIAVRSKANDNGYLWNIYLLGLPNWFKWNKTRKNKLEFSKIEYIIKNSTQEFDKERKEFNLYLNFNEIFN
ncbi:MAG: hypothetical protein ACTSPS_04810 [Promethearchaeota archaeon]